MSDTFRKTSISTAIKLALVGSGTALALAATSPTLASDTGASEVDSVKQEVEQLLLRIEELESTQRQQKAFGEEVSTTPDEEVIQLTAPAPRLDRSMPKELADPDHQDYTPPGEEPISFRLGQSNTEVTVSGYVKLDAIYDVDQDVGDSFIFSSIAPDGSDAAERGPHARLHAKQSRIRVKSSTPVGDEEIKTHIEVDFLGQGGNQTFSNSTTLRMRHAYITYGGWLFGQYWTNFMENDFVAYPSTADFFGPVGQAFVRQAQIRYTWDNGLSVSLENPETVGNSETGGSFSEAGGSGGSDELPDLTVAWRGGDADSGGAYEFAAISRELGIKADAPPGVNDGDFDVDETENGVGFMAAGGWNLGDSAYLYAHYNWGDGIGRYIINGFNNDLFVDASGNVDTVESSGGNIGVTFDVGDQDQINVVWGFFENDTPEESNGIDKLTSLHVGYFNNRGNGLTLGYEVIVGEADYVTTDGTDVESDGENTRFQFMAQKSF